MKGKGGEDRGRDGRGKERREEEREGEERRGLQLWVWSGSLQPLAAPSLHLLSGLLKGHTPWPGPRNQRVRTRLRGEKKGEQEEEGRIAQKKVKNRPDLMQKYCQKVPLNKRV